MTKNEFLSLKAGDNFTQDGIKYIVMSQDINGAWCVRINATGHVMIVQGKVNCYYYHWNKLVDVEEKVNSWPELVDAAEKVNQTSSASEIINKMPLGSDIFRQAFALALLESHRQIQGDFFDMICKVIHGLAQSKHCDVRNEYAVKMSREILSALRHSL
jgi:hypothetical protein